MNASANHTTSFWHKEDWSSLDYLPASARTLITHKGSLTEALNKRYGKDEVRVSVEKTEIEPATAAINAQLNLAEKELTKRVVLICLGKKPYIYAETHMPTWAADELPWLAQLENQPLGRYLFSDPEIKRSEFTYSLYDLSELDVEILFDHDIVLWARRSLFTAQGASGVDVPLLVTEVFMHHVAPSIVNQSFFGVEHHC